MIVRAGAFRFASASAISSTATVPDASSSAPLKILSGALRGLAAAQVIEMRRDQDRVA